MSTSSSSRQPTPTAQTSHSFKDSTPKGNDAAHTENQLAIGTVGGERPEFSYDVPASGYTWWYIDGLSDDGRYAITVIAFIGSVFSPYYYRARKEFGQAVDPRDFCAFNVALYGCGRGQWAMTERDSQALEQHSERLRIGPSMLTWKDGKLYGEFDEETKPLPGRVQGRFRLMPQLGNSQTFFLDPTGRHRWHPLTPRARLEVELDSPKLSWQGQAYLDTNAGDEPLEDGFIGWQWSQAADSDGVTLIYDVQPRHSDAHVMAYRIEANRAPQPLELPTAVELPKTLWRLPRRTFTDNPHTPRVTKTLEDTPFYSRSVVENSITGKRLTAIHESLSMDRFTRGSTQWMLPWRMPRHPSRD